MYKGLWEGKVVSLNQIQVPSGEDRYKLLANNQQIVALK